MKLKLLIIFLTILSNHIFANHFECISLGQTCTTAAALKAFNLRNAAYPFDWVVSSFSALRGSITDNFKDYLNPNYLQLAEGKRRIINKYKIAFAHDFPTIHYTGPDFAQEDLITENVLVENWRDALPSIQAKYERRINRFIEKCHSQNKVYFLRHFDTTREQAIQLRNIIESKYPNLDFTLVVIGRHPSYAKTWRENKIQNFYLNDTHVWNDVKEWNKIFKKLGILPTIKVPNSLRVAQYQKNLCGNCDYCQRKRFNT